MTSTILDRVVAGPRHAGHRLRVAGLTGVTDIPLEELHQQAGRVAAMLVEGGAGRGSRIGVLAANGLDWVRLDLAALRIGAIVGGLDPHKFAGMPGVAKRYGLAMVFADRPGTPGARSIDEVAASAVVADVLSPPPAAWGPKDTPALKFTSGSTGMPKAMLATAGSIDSSLTAVQQMFAHGPGDDLFVFLPLSLVQQRYWVYSAFANGHDVTVATYESALAMLRRCAPTVVMGVPGFFDTVRRRIESVAARETEGDRGQELRSAARVVLGNRVRYLWTGSAPASAATLEFFERCGINLFEGYGMNETCIVSKNHPGAWRRGSVGQILPDKRVTIDSDGVVVVHSDHPVARDYTYAPDGASGSVFRSDGAVRTGDRGYLDDDGFLYIQGRADDTLVLGNGRKVDVRPIEEALSAGPEIDECVIFASDTSDLVAVVSPADGEPPESIRQVLASAAVSLLPDQRPSRVLVADPPFSRENGMLTSQFKPARPTIYGIYQEAIRNRKAGFRVDV